MAHPSQFPTPPETPQRWLARALEQDPAGAAILGDLLEDFHGIHRESGDSAASRWYWRQATTLAASVFLFRCLRLLSENRTSKEPNMIRDALSPRGALGDLRYAAKALRRDLGLVAFSTLIIGLGVGATTAVFSLMSPLLVKPLPFHEPDRLVWIANQPEGGRSAQTSRTSNLRDFRELSTQFESIAGYMAFFEQASYTLTGKGNPERLAGVGVTDNFLEVLGVEPILGRNFTEEEGERMDDSSILLSHALWRQRFAADESIVGETLTINGAPSTVVGVLPPTFDFSSLFSPGTRVDLLTTFPISDATDRWGNTLSMIGRLAPDAGLTAASAEIESILERLRTEQPDRWGLDANLRPLSEQVSGSHRTALLLLFGAAAAVMLIVCVNLASLLLSKGINRRSEMQLRSALGAPAGRLLRQMLLESLALACGGAVLGVALAIWLTNAVASSTAISIPLLASARVDTTALLFSVCMAVTAGVAVGALPALQASLGATGVGLRESGRTVSTSQRSRWLRESLVVAEVAIACTLLIVGGLLLQSFSRVLDVDLGFDQTELAAWLVDTDREFETLDERSTFFGSLIDEVRAIPGVDAAGLTDAIPLGINRGWTIGIPGRIFEPGESPGVFPHIVDRHYIETMGIPMLSGRGFRLSDDNDSESVAIINESAATELFPDRDAVGQSITLGGTEIRIIGVVADVRHLSLEKGSGMELYLPIRQSGDFGTLDLVVRSSQPLDVLAGSVAPAIRRIDPNMPTNDFRSLSSVVDQSVSPRRFTLRLLIAFAATAVLLAALGIYGVLSYTVSERAREIGIRMALGESATQVRSRVLGRTVLLAGIGAVFGVAAALGASNWLTSLLYGVTPNQPATLALMPGGLLLVAVLASWLPAARASRLDALSTLRST